MSKQEVFKCDIKACGKPCGVDDHHSDLQVIFVTDQTEGRSIDPYLCPVNIDLCEDCVEHLLKGNYIFASGAQGANEYYFLKRKK